MSEVYGFTEPERQRFLEMWKWYKTQSPARVARHVEPEDFPAPDVYIAKSPAGGIRALRSAMGTDAYDSPGDALCKIYRIVENQEGYTGTGPGDDELHEMESTTKRVYNIYKMDVPPNTWMLIARTKGGVWVVTSILFDTTEC